MLETHYIHPSFSRDALFNQFDVHSDVWIVADLEQKRFVQNQLLERFGALPEDACLRASEFWIKLLFQCDPKCTVVSKSFMEVILKEWLPRQNLTWATGQTSVPTLTEYLQFFLPVFASASPNESVTLMRQWLKENPDSMLRWGAWFELSVAAWNELRERRVVLASWAPALVLSHEHFLNSWSRRMILDLGAEISTLEVDLFLQLSKKVDMVVLEPAPEWRAQYPKALWPYELLTGKSSADEKRLRPQDGVECRRYITKLSEVKACTSQVRDWLDQGVRPSDIAVFAADPETYWPVLRSYFQVEGIPVAKDVVVVLQSLPTVGRWISEMKVQIQVLSSEDFEMSLYGKKMRLPVEYERFRVFLSEIYEEQDILRLQEVKSIFADTIRAERVLSRDEFVAFSVRCWDLDEDPELFKDVISTILLESTADMRLSVESWISFVQSVVAKLERRLSEGDPEGVAIRKLSSAVITDCLYVFCLGLDEASLTDIESLNVSFSEAVRISNDIGFQLPRPEPAKNMFLAHWLSLAKFNKAVLGYPMTDFSGEPSAPSIFWLDQFRQTSQAASLGEEVDLNFTSRWDELQQLDLTQMSQLRNFSESVLTGVQEDRGLVNKKTVPLSFKPKWSASQLENYQKCPFKFTANRLLRLRDEPEVDLDMDRMRRGRLLHKVLELVLQQGLHRDWSDKDLLDLIEVGRFAEGIYVYSSIWPQYKKTFLRILRNFLQFETDWRQNYSATKTVAMELEFQGEWLGFPISGKIDRVDSDEAGHYIIIDYKTSGFDLKNFDSWLNNHQLQLMVYVKAIESGWTSLPPGKVVGANYFDLRSMDRQKGFYLDDESLNLYPVVSRKRNIADAETLEALKQEFENLVQDIGRRMDEGRYFAAPEDATKYCKNCEWSTLCRAPHLNL